MRRGGDEGVALGLKRLGDGLDQQWHRRRVGDRRHGADAGEGGVAGVGREVVACDAAFKGGADVPDGAGARIVVRVDQGDGNVGRGEDLGDSPAHDPGTEDHGAIRYVRRLVDHRGNVPQPELPLPLRKGPDPERPLPNPSPVATGEGLLRRRRCA